jgi:desulfoferrodoxin-like iron-binding protein
MANAPESVFPQWDLAEWERALTIRVGTAYACRHCGNLVMVTKGGVGVMELVCCGAPMEEVVRPSGEAGEAPV